MTAEPELTGSGLRIPLADGRSATIALVAGPGEVILVIADPSASDARTGRPAPIAVDYPLSLTALKHLCERAALVGDDARRLGEELEPVEPRVPRRAPARDRDLPQVASAHA